jgi:hypothetical protein
MIVGYPIAHYAFRRNPLQDALLAPARLCFVERAYDPQRWQTCGQVTVPGAVVSQLAPQVILSEVPRAATESGYGTTSQRLPRLSLSGIRSLLANSQTGPLTRAS